MGAQSFCVGSGVSEDQAVNLVFFIPCIPPTCTSQMKGARIVQPRGKKPFIHWYKKPELEQAERTWAMLLSQHRPAAPFAGPVCLTLNFVYPWRKSELKSVIAKFERMPIATRPDVDNSSKLVLDVLTRLSYWTDDGQVASLTLTKHYGDHPGLGVIVTPAMAETRTGERVAVT